MVSGFSTFAFGDGLNSYAQTNLVSDLPGVASHQDANLVNPWGIVASPTSPFWISDNGTGLSTLYDGAGATIPLVVSIPPSGGAAPTGIVFNGTGGFAGSHFIFATEGGTIAAWTSGTAAVSMGSSASGSVYKGLALGNNGSGDLLYAANFGLGRVDVFDTNFAATTVPGGFKDANLPAGYAPFNIQNLNGKLYVTYALQDAAHEDDVAGLGHGFIDVFDFNGNMLEQQEPYPAVVIDRLWNLQQANEAAQAFTVFLFEGPPPPPSPGKSPNLLRWLLDPKALRAKVSNWEEVARYLVSTTYAEILADGGEPKALAFIEEIMAYPDVPASFRKLRFEERPTPVLTVDYLVGGKALSVFTTIATLGTPQDITLQEVRIECFFPADERSDALFRSLAAKG